MATDPIDRISVEIETSSTVAENGVSALVRSLESLNSVLNKIADTDAAKALKNVGKTAQKASAETSVQAKQSVLTRATRTVRESPAAKQQEQIRQSVRYSRVPNSAAQKEWAQTVRYLQGNGEKPDLDQKINLSELKKSIKESEKIEIDMMKKLDGFYDKFKSIQGENIIGKNAESALGDAEQKLTQLRDSINETRDAAASLDDILKKIENGNGQDIKQSDINGLIEQYRMAGSAARSAGIEADNAMKTAKDAIAQAQAKADEMRESLFANRTIWSAIKSAASNALEDVKTKLAEAASQSKLLAGAIKLGVPIIGTLGSILGSVLRGGLTLLGKLWSGFKRLASTIAGAVVGGLQKLGSILKTVGGSVLNYVTKPFQRAISVIQKWKKTLGRLVFLRVVRSAIKEVTDGFKEGIENLYYFSSLTESQFKPAMDSLASSSLYLKNSLGAMAAPLIQAVAPAVNYLIDLFVSLLNVINMVFSVLGGRTYTKALKTSAKYADDLDKSLGGGAAAAKELKRYLIGIDELNVIPDQGGSGGGGGGGDIGAGYEDMFEEVPIPDWALNIRDLIKKGKWYEAGEALADEVNKLIDKFAEKAPIWGTKIGQAIQDAIEFGLGFIRRLNIEKFAAALSTLIGNALNEINPRDLGAILASGIKSIFRFAHGFLQGYTGPEIGHYLAEVVNGWFDELRRDNGWKKAGQDLNQVILDIINGVSNFIKDLDFESIGSDLKEFFAQIDWKGIWESLKNLAKTAADEIPWGDMLDGLLTALANVIIFAHDTIFGLSGSEITNQVWNPLKEKLKSGEPANWIDIIAGLTSFLSDIITPIMDSIQSEGWEGFWDQIKENIAGALTNGTMTWDELKETVTTTIVDVLWDAIKTAFSILGMMAMEGIIGLVKTLNPFTGTLFESFWNGTLEKAGINVEVDATKTTAFEEAMDVLDGVKDGVTADLVVDGWLTDSATQAMEVLDGTPENRTATITVKTVDRNRSTREEIAETWAIVNDKTPTLAASVVDSSNGQMELVSGVWSSVNDKNVTMRAMARNTNAETLAAIVSDFSFLNDKTVTMTANGVVDQSFNNARDNFNGVTDKTSTVTVNGNRSSSFNSAVNAYNSISSKAVTLTVNGKSNLSNMKYMLNAGGGIFAGGRWHPIQGYASGGSPRKSRLFYANENGMPELIGRIGGNTAVMNNGQIVASVASGVYRAVTAAMGSVGTYFSSIANSIARIPAAMAISEEKPRFNNVFQEENMYQQVQMASGNRNGNDEVSFRGDEDNGELINALYAMGQRIIEAINSKDTSIILDGNRVGSGVTRVQNRQNRAAGRSLSNAYGGGF